MGQQLPPTHNPIIQANKKDMFEANYIQRIKDTPFIDAQLYTSRPLLFIDPMGPTLAQLVGPRIGTKQLFPQAEVINLMDSVVSALIELSQNGFQGHGDLSLDTIYYNPKQKNFKLTHPAFNEESGYLLTKHGKRFTTLSPEQLSALSEESDAQEISMKSDVFVLGIILCEVCTLTPSSDIYCPDTYSIFHLQIQKRLKLIEQYYPQTIVNFIHMCLIQCFKSILNRVSIPISQVGALVSSTILITGLVCLNSLHIWIKPPLRQTKQSDNDFLGEISRLSLLLLHQLTTTIIFKQMSMNTRDERLYHYQYRRPRPYNPTYNSNNVFDSLNMFIRTDLPPLLARSQGRYSLPKVEQPYQNRSEVIDYRSRGGLNNYSTISTEMQRGRQANYPSDYENRYVPMPQESRRKVPEERVYSRMGENPESRGGNLNYKLHDSLTRQIQEFQAKK